MPGPVPKPESKRRQANKPRSYGDAEATTAPAAQSVADRQLGIQNAHPLIASIWDTVQSSCESAFYSESDWARLRMELWFADHTMASGRPSGQAWAVIQDGMNAMLISPAVKRREIGIELRPSAVDEDENAAVSMIGRYRQSLKPV